ncbi:DNAdirected RNA polymerase, beta subunit [Pelomyxa schiedti]|nr:DNAdirected RNA polymerase, beta subunit [Pelomyxa schiedti]
MHAASQPSSGASTPATTSRPRPRTTPGTVAASPSASGAATPAPASKSAPPLTPSHRPRASASAAATKHSTSTSTSAAAGRKIRVATAPAEYPGKRRTCEHPMRYTDVPAEQSEGLRDAVRQHVDSFNFFLGEGKDRLVRHLTPALFELRTKQEPQGAGAGLGLGEKRAEGEGGEDAGESEEAKAQRDKRKADTTEESGWAMKVKVKEITIHHPRKNGMDPLYPFECREGNLSYTSPVSAKLQVSFPPYPGGSGGTVKHDVSVSLGRIPLMVCSSLCWLNSEVKKPKDMVALHEDENEMGGYFIINGLEKLSRMLIYQRPNHPVVVNRPSWQSKSPLFSSLGCMIRCMRDDSTTQTCTLHYLTDSTARLRFIHRKQEFFLPIVTVLRALGGLTDKEIFERITRKDPNNPTLVGAAEMLLRKQSENTTDPSNWPGVDLRKSSLLWLGQNFQFQLAFPSNWSVEKVGKKMLQKFVLVHLESPIDKCNLLIFMMQKLYAAANGEIEEDNVDSPMNHCILTSGHLYLTVFKDHLQDWLFNLKTAYEFECQKKSTYFTLERFKKLADSTESGVGRKMLYFLATGTHNSKNSIDLMQTTGFVLVAEKLNIFRWLSHFQSVHRGSFYAEMKTTSIRKLMPESWGFFCPVHTPDGAPCGLLNHLAVACKVMCTDMHDNLKAIEEFLYNLGMLNTTNTVLPSFCVSVLLNGRLIGQLPQDRCKAVTDALRLAKIKHLYNIPWHLEIVYVDGKLGNGYTSIYLSTDMARMIRPVLHVPTGLVEWIGIFEQVFMDIACSNTGAEPLTLADAEHRELTPTNMLSLLANTIPFPDMNQSPRNMYQCQMAKHTMATPCANYAYRLDTKMLHLNYPQRPILRTKYDSPYRFGSYPQGTNAVIAVISYTGYDMEDAFIVNKASAERGFAHASMFKTYKILLEDDRKYKGSTEYCLGHDGKGRGKDILDRDGLPSPGDRISANEPFYTVMNRTTGELKPKISKGEEAVVDQVRVIGSFDKSMGYLTEKVPRLKTASVKLRYNRNPVIGDKFAARHGQKGVLSQLWPQQDMPFTESGMTPDVIINPHAFPSRMTIGMLVECMASKSGALHGTEQDCSPFVFDEKNRAVDYFGEQLVKAGYNYFGNEPLYSGITGTPFYADIFFGIVYYQRLVHQVKDKYQVRAQGPVNQLTQQPLHGRKRGGGIRFGEMERDSIIGHGASYLLHDRLFVCSDKSMAFVCTKCGSITSPVAEQTTGVASCTLCKSRTNVTKVAIPFVLRYLAAELSAMNIKVVLDCNMAGRTQAGRI